LLLVCACGCLWYKSEFIFVWNWNLNSHKIQFPAFFFFLYVAKYLALTVNLLQIMNFANFIFPDNWNSKNLPANIVTSEKYLP
jgi:hypothetical protein